MASRPLIVRRRLLRAARILFFGAGFCVATYFFLKEGRTIVVTDIADNNLFVTAKAVTRAAAGWIGMLLAAACLTAVVRHGRVYLSRGAALGLLVLLVPLLLYLWHFTQSYSLKHLAVSGDETSLLFQAEVFSRGMLWNSRIDPSITPHFKRHHVVTLPDREFSKYPPGFPALLALCELTSGIEWTNIFVSLAIFFLFYLVAVRLSGSRVTAALAAIFFTLTTSVAFHAASYFSHPPVMLLVLALAAVLMRACTDREPTRNRYLVAAGAVAGLILFFRPWDAFLTVVAIGLFFLRELFSPPGGKAFSLLVPRLRSFARTVLLFSAGAIPLLLLFLLYQKIYTGSFFTSPYQLYYYGVKLIPSEQINEIYTDWENYLDKGLLGFTPNWLKAQADWTNKHLIWALLALPIVRLGRLRRFEWLVFFLPFVFVLGYAIHNSGGGDSFGARYYYPALWCWFYGAAETARAIGRLLGRFFITRPLFWLPYAAFLLALFWYWRDDFPGKETGIMRGVNKRFALYDHVERRVPPFEKAIVLVKTPTAMDRSFFTRHAPDFSDRIIYGRYFEKATLVSDLKRGFPDRTIYVFNWKKQSKTIEFLRLEKDEDAPHEEKMENTHR